jgi:methionine-rich copper-binding protein CopC
MFVTRLLRGLLLLLPASVSSLATVPAQAHDVVVHSQPAKNGSVRAGEVTVEIEYSGQTFSRLPPEVSAPASTPCTGTSSPRTVT